MSISPAAGGRIIMNILESAIAIQDQIKEYRHHIHRNPEIGFYLPKTAAYVQEKLAEMGIESQLCGGPIDDKVRQKFVAAGFPDMAESTGVVATIGHGEPCFMLRADMDALPMTETPDLVDFTSEIPGVAHMCGHDAHTAMLLGAAKLLKERENELKGTVKLMFQTGEECGCGSRLMIEHGLLENPKVDAAFAIHVMSEQELGTVGFTPGITSAAMDTFMVKIKGRGGHSSTPHLCIDPLMIANQLYTTLNLLPGREIDPRETIALTSGRAGGGTAVNIIPDEAEVMVAARTFNREVTHHIVERIPEIVDHTVKMWRGSYDMIDFHTPSTYNDEALCDELRPSIEEVMGKDKVYVAPCMAGTEDFGYVGEEIPAMYATLGVGGKGAAPMHNPSMFVDESMLAYGTALHVTVAVNWLENHSK